MNKIKELRNKIGKTDFDNLSIYDTTVLVLNIADYLVEKEEIEEKKLREKFIPSDSGSVGVEVGQIWRSELNKSCDEKFFFEVLNVDNKVTTLKNNKGVEFDKLTCNFKYLELVTMDNIKLDEYFKCIDDDTFKLERGVIYKMTKLDKCGQIFIDGCYYQKKHFEPCLSPVKITEFEFKSVDEVKEIGKVENYFRVGKRAGKTESTKVNIVLQNVSEGIHFKYIEGTEATKVIISEDVHKLMKHDYIKISGMPPEATFTLCGLKILIANDPNGELVDFVEVI